MNSEESKGRYDPNIIAYELAKALGNLEARVSELNSYIILMPARIRYCLSLSPDVVVSQRGERLDHFQGVPIWISRSLREDVDFTVMPKSAAAPIIKGEWDGSNLVKGLLKNEGIYV